MGAVDYDLENVKIANQHGSDALKYLFLLNGGASIAFLTFLGSLAIGPQNGIINVADIAGILAYFSIGAGLCVLSNALNYLNVASDRIGLPKYQKYFYWATIGCAAASLILFFLGVFLSAVVFGAVEIPFCD